MLDQVLFAGVELPYVFFCFVLSSKIFKSNLYKTFRKTSNMHVLLRSLGLPLRDVSFDLLFNIFRIIGRRVMVQTLSAIVETQLSGITAVYSSLISVFHLY